jgi:hypothetical protein
VIGLHFTHAHLHLVTIRPHRGDVYLELTFFASGPALLNRRPSKFTNPAERLARPPPLSDASKSGPSTSTCIRSTSGSMFPTHSARSTTTPLLDSLGALLSESIAGLSVRQAMLFLLLSTCKTVYDYCGYGLPFDRLQMFSSNTADYHDIHHQVIDSISTTKSELTHRIMLVNLLRLLGAIKTKKASRQIVTRPTPVLLPLSPNHELILRIRQRPFPTIYFAQYFFTCYQASQEACTAIPTRGTILDSKGRSKATSPL